MALMVNFPGLHPRRQHGGLSAPAGEQCGMFEALKNKPGFFRGKGLQFFYYSIY
jgi:hypothetical protein